MKHCIVTWTHTKRIFIGLLWCFACVAQANPLTKVVVFGDSLSDTGNLYEYMQHQLPVSPPYFEGRFTNGPVWVEHVMRHYYPDAVNEHLLNYAFGGSGIAEDNEDDVSVFTLRSEVDSYLLAHHDAADTDSLFVVWMGANNYISSPDDVEQAVEMVNAGIMEQTERLVKQGAQHIMLMSIPNLGKTPWATDFELTDLWSELSIRHNTLLKNNFTRLQKEYPNVQWLFLDVDRMFLAALDAPELYGITNTTGTCYEAAMPVETTQSMSVLKMVSAVKPEPRSDAASACDGYLFFDPIHPAAVAHELIGQEAIKLFQAQGIEFH